MTNRTTKPVAVDEALRIAISHHQAGRLPEAEVIYNQILEVHPSHADALHLLGMLARQKGNDSEAVDLMEQSITSNPNNPASHNNLGNVLTEQGRLADAICRFEQALVLQPDFAAAHNGLGSALKKQGRLSEAVSRFEQALALRPEYAEAHNNLGSVFKEQDQFEEAISRYEQALTIKPDYAEAHNNLGNVYKEQGRFDEAVKQYERALALRPDFAEGHYNLGSAVTQQGRLDEAIDRFERAIALKPDHAAACANLGSLHEKLNQLDEASAYASKAAHIDPDDPFTKRLLATLLRREGKHEEALDILKSIPLTHMSNHIACGIHFEMGRLYDLVKDSEAAMQHFLEANRVQSETPESKRFDKSAYLHVVKQNKSRFTRHWVDSWAGLAKEDGPRDIVFLVGFPRSGTTLLDQILDGHPRIAVIEERPMISDLVERLRGHAEGYPSAIATLNDHEIQELRAQYLSQVREYVGDYTNLTVIDKFPLNIVHVGLIYRLFPSARIIFALRHPYDVCLSNLFQNYSINDAMANFFSLEDTAELYFQVMELWKTYLEVLPVNYFQIKYESLVCDLEGEIKGLLGFLNLEWDPRLTDYANHARERGHINTPSYSQVTQPIYERSKYRWLRYDKYFDSVNEKLNAHAAHFGYSTES